MMHGHESRRRRLAGFVTLALAVCAAACGAGGDDEAAASSEDAVTVSGCSAGSQTLTMERGAVRLTYDLRTGRATFAHGGAAKVRGFYAGVRVGTEYVTSTTYATHECSTSGDQATVTSTAAGRPVMTQLFVLPGGNHLLTRVTVAGSSLSSSWMGPVVVDDGGVDIGTHGDHRVLWVPFDNNGYDVRYGGYALNGRGTSSEVAAFYDNDSRHAIAVGSVTHDTWKTGVWYDAANGHVDKLNVFGGFTDAHVTHDSLPHRAVTGATLYSPIVFVGASDDWRSLMEEYADANTAYVARLPGAGGAPFGWNSWWAYGKKDITLGKLEQVSKFVHDELEPRGFRDDQTAYVDLDAINGSDPSAPGYLSEADLTSFVATVHHYGQRAGAYMAPFMAFDNSDPSVLLVRPDGQPVVAQTFRNANGTTTDAYARDPTNPKWKDAIAKDIARYERLGFQLLKLDFLSYGALESARYADPSVQTGIQAYSAGMKFIRDQVAGTMFLSESIAPLFPYEYAHARRVSCDTRGAAVGLDRGSSEYELNAAAYGWWASGRLYSYGDPDAMVFRGFTPQANRTRLISGVVSGTVFFDGDDLTNPEARALAKQYLGNGRVDAVARLGKPFVPVEGDTGSGTPTVLVLHDGRTTYVAMFDFGSGPVTRRVRMDRLGLAADRTYHATNVLEGNTFTARGELSVPLDADDAKLFALE